MFLVLFICKLDDTFPLRQNATYRKYSLDWYNLMHGEQLKTLWSRAGIRSL